ncbi:YgiT-type zinc finger protein [Tumebacillus permanentifrigoris]|uniref:YgiT-type zinc finger domain-containing protein n=1 Tax=Tumebacillus permanentifrigoris TaxID=378543 RepID=A0A316DG31_9BACL|nr:YgiT-type zinc finger protein [Tumebacillus permanentifrigoris]PWK16492.1 YgiT-type zinc finger domain-containing protein [Tumebacillus permanentifrigoris]
MMVMDSRDSTNKTCICACGGVMLYKVGTITRTIRNTEIRIHKVPHFDCTSCGELEFDLDTKIPTLTVYAYQAEISEAVWSEDLLEDMKQGNPWLPR